MPRATKSRYFQVWVKRFLVEFETQFDPLVPNSTGIRELTYCPFRAILVVICKDLALHAYRSAIDGVLQGKSLIKTELWDHFDEL